MDLWLPPYFFLTYIVIHMLLHASLFLYELKASVLQFQRYVLSS